MFICITNLYNYTCTMHIGISSSIQLIQMFICITNIKKYNLKISDTIACRNVLFTNNLKKNKHTWLCKTPVPIYPVIEPIDTTFYIVLRGKSGFAELLSPWITWAGAVNIFVPLLGTLNLLASENHIYSISKAFTQKINCITLFSTKTNLWRVCY